MRFNVLSLFPEVITAYGAASILGRAQAAQLLEIATYDIRSFALDKHKTVDDTPYGGGAGMVMKIEPIDRALAKAREDSSEGTHRSLVLSARGIPFTQRKAEEYAQYDTLTLVCGRYEGIDQRVADHLVDEEVSIGSFVLAGGELAALSVIEATARLLPGVLGNPASLAEESFSSTNSNLEYPQYTKPATYNDWSVPQALLSGDHEAIRTWRKEHGKQA